MRPSMDPWLSRKLFLFKARATSWSWRRAGLLSIFDGACDLSVLQAGPVLYTHRQLVLRCSSTPTSKGETEILAFESFTTLSLALLLPADKVTHRSFSIHPAWRRVAHIHPSRVDTDVVKAYGILLWWLLICMRTGLHIPLPKLHWLDCGKNHLDRTSRKSSPPLLSTILQIPSWKCWILWRMIINPPSPTALPIRTFFDDLFTLFLGS